MAVADSDLSRWLLQQFGPGKRYKSARQLSLAAGQSDTVVSRLIERGSGNAETLIAIARAARVDPLIPLVMAGWLTESEASGDLAPDEARLIRVFRQLGDTQKRVLREVAESMLAPTSQRGG